MKTSAHRVEDNERHRIVRNQEICCSGRRKWDVPDSPGRPDSHLPMRRSQTTGGNRVMVLHSA